MKQGGGDEAEALTPVVLITHETTESAVRKALEDIKTMVMHDGDRPDDQDRSALAPFLMDIINCRLGREITG